jgi:AraC family transcriptional regulator of adaptative response/methylated-DNA-[protein]-cysteine methyltransferase
MDSLQVSAMNPTTTAQTMEADPRWALLRGRDKTADGCFVYAVRTTGVFCRPSCPSRLPRAENVAFFADAAAARASGFRPCLRCHPEDAGAQDQQAARMASLAAYIDRHADEKLTLAGLAAEAGLSPAHLQRSFTRVLGVSPKAYHEAARLAVFKGRLRQGDDVLGAVFEAGYGSTSRAYARVDGGLGMTPAAYRADGRGETIVFAVRKTAMGLLMMGATARGVCFVQFGDSEAALVEALRAEFSKAVLRPAGAEADGDLADWMAALDAHLSAGGKRPDLPLDLRGTAFQIRVWRFLLSVKAGDVVSYAEIAAGVGAPGAARAVGSACGANRLAVLVPCHRALRADGGLGGYRWGLARKRVLLDQERGTAADAA